MLIRAAHSADLPGIARLWRSAWAAANSWAHTVEPLSHWMERVRHEFTHPYCISVIEVNETIIGFAVFDTNEAYLAQLFVDQKNQGQSFGSALLRHVDQLMLKDWYLYVAVSNTAAQDFYERRGLVRGAMSLNPDSLRERIRYCAKAGSIH